MARPNKAEVERREKIKELGLFARNSYMYQALESCSTMEENALFCKLCAVRNIKKETRTHDYEGNIINHKKTLEHLNYFYLWEELKFKNEFLAIDRKKVNMLNDISPELTVYFDHIWYGGTFNIHFEKGIVEREPYFNKTTISISILREALGEKRLDDLIKQRYDFFAEDNQYIDIENIYNDLTQKEKKEIYTNVLISEYPEPKTIIYNRMSYDNTAYNLFLHRVSNSVFVELDLSKNLDSLIHFVKKLKTDYDNKGIKNYYGLMGVPLHNTSEDMETIFKQYNNKPSSGRLADVLFIYDCKFAGLDNQYILDEINTYWTETKNLFKENMQLKTLQDYHKLAIDYIDNSKYSNYLSGFKSGLDL